MIVGLVWSLAWARVTVTRTEMMTKKADFNSLARRYASRLIDLK